MKISQEEKNQLLVGHSCDAFLCVLNYSKSNGNKIQELKWDLFRKGFPLIGDTLKPKLTWDQ